MIFYILLKIRITFSKYKFDKGLFYATGIFLLYCLFSSFISTQVSYSFNKFLAISTYILFYFLSYTQIVDLSKIKKIFVIFLIFHLFFLLFTVAISENNIYRFSYNLIYQYINPGKIIDQNLTAFSLINFILICSLFLNDYKKKIGINHFSILLIFLISIIFSSRSAFLGSILILISSLILFKTNKLIINIFLIFSLFYLFYLFGFGGFQLSNSYNILIQKFETIASDGRIILFNNYFSEYINSGLLNIFFGKGFMLVNSHNFYLNYLFNTGLIGLIISNYFFYTISKNIIKSCKSVVDNKISKLIILFNFFIFMFYDIHFIFFITLYFINLKNRNNIEL